MHDTDFIFNLIKGKVTEIIFEKMFSESNQYTILPSGYEHTLPMLAQYQSHAAAKNILEILKKYAH